MKVAELKGRRIAVLLGGTSPEREVSLQSGAAVVSALQELGAEVLAVDTAEANWWQQAQSCELAWICLHGAGGEDGTMQGFLQTMGMPYTGSGVLGSALAMDKLMSKDLWRGIGVATADFAELTNTTDWQSVIDQLGRAFVKPASGGSSIGTAGVGNAEELAAAWQQAARFGDKVIAERLIEGEEYTVGVLNDGTLPAIKLETDNEFYDYEAKYVSDDTRYLCPCGLAAAAEAELAALALRAFKSLGCAGWGRVDLMRDAAGTFWVLEVNTVPGMTSHSLVPKAARETGISMAQLVGQIACLGLGGLTQ